MRLRLDQGTVRVQELSPLVYTFIEVGFGCVLDEEADLRVQCASTCVVRTRILSAVC